MKVVKPNPGAQEKALASNVFELFYGGAAGGGKSFFLLMDAIGQIEKPNYRALLLRRTFPELEKSLILESQQLYRHLGGVYNASAHRWTFKSGAIIDFGYLDSAQAVFNYQSAQYSFIGFDEASHFTAFQIEYMKSRCRCADATVNKYIRYASNPGNVGHKFFYERFIKGKEPYTVYRDGLTGLTMQFIPAKLSDNKVLVESDPQYRQRLEGLPEEYRKMLLDGDWTYQSIKGTYYGDLVTQMRLDKRITDVPYEKFLPVSVWFDLGMDDSMTMGFYQFLGPQKRMIDYVEESGYGIEHYVDVLRDKKYNYDTIWLPHDAKVRELGTGKSRYEIFKSLMPGTDVRFVPRIAQGSGKEVQEGINAVRATSNALYRREEMRDGGYKS